MQSAPESYQIADDLARRAGRLFSLPAVAVEVLRLTEDPEVEATKIKECIEKDPALTARILRVVNSSLFGPARTIDNLGQAVAMLGIKPLKLLVLGFSLPPELFANIAANQLRLYWLRALTKAVLCRGLSESLANRSGDEAFLTGLLADIGQLVLIQELGEPYIKLLDEVEQDRLELSTVQRHALGIEHSMLSSALLRQWKMPEIFCQTIDESSNLLAHVNSEDDFSAGNLDEWPEDVIILSAADLLTQVLTGDAPVKVPMIEQLVHSLPNYSPDRLKETVLHTQHKVEGLAEIFSVRLPDSLDYAEVIEEAFYRMSDFALQCGLDLAEAELTADSQEVQLSEDCRLLAAELQRLLVEDKPKRESTTDPNEKYDTSTDPPSEPIGPHCIERKPKEEEKPEVSANGLTAILFEKVDEEVNRCRTQRRPLCLLITSQIVLHRIAMDTKDESLAFYQPLLQRILEKAVGDRGKLIPIDTQRTAVLLPDFERRESVELGGQVARLFTKALATIRPGEENNVTAAVGIAAADPPAKNFETQRLIGAAADCLHASVACDGGIVKSIVVY